ncbi:hypothetical protein AB1283_12095 [Bacillus sp. S13(2024)]|uniref:DUF7018 domain-containing (lipo)protein n=1 Tax=unclassified Bacillus (in: firmicutes) TaxID=185979 RepID=UPI003D1E6714
MRVNRLLCFAIPLMLLGGCGTNSSADKVDKKADTKVEQKSETKDVKKENKLTVAKEETSTKQLTVKEYAPAIMEPMTDVIKIQTEIQKLSVSDKPFDELRTEMKGYVSRLKVYYNKVREINPPNEFKEDHKQMVKAMDTYDEAYKLQLEAFDTKSTSKMNESVEKLKEAGKLFKEASTNIGNKRKEILSKEGNESN